MSNAACLTEITKFLDGFAPPGLAEEWDNVGLLIGTRDAQVENVMTCLTVTRESVAEAIERRVNLIVSHHPFPFKGMKRITDDTEGGRLLFRLVRANINVYSPHTAFDSTQRGINQMLAEGIGLVQIDSLRPLPGFDVGAGRIGRFPAAVTVEGIANRLKTTLNINEMQLVGNPQQTVSTVGIACGSAGEFLDQARRKGCDLFITGEMSFHRCLAAKAEGIQVLLTGHFASERFAVERLAQDLGKEFPKLGCFASQREADPLTTLR